MLDPQQYIFDIGVYKSLNFAQVQELGYEKLEILQPNGGDLWDEFNRLKDEYFIKSTDLTWELLVNDRQKIIDKVKEYIELVDGPKQANPIQNESQPTNLAPLLTLKEVKRKSRNESWSAIVGSPPMKTYLKTNQDNEYYVISQTNTIQAQAERSAETKTLELIDKTDINKVGKFILDLGDKVRVMFLIPKSIVSDDVRSESNPAPIPTEQPIEIEPEVETQDPITQQNQELDADPNQDTPVQNNNEEVNPNEIEQPADDSNDETTQTEAEFTPVQLTQEFRPTIAPTQISFDKTGESVSDDVTSKILRSGFSQGPLVYYNGVLIDVENIQYFTLYHENMLPAISINFKDAYGIFSGYGFPNDDSIITIFLHPITERLRPIYMDFKVTGFKNVGNSYIMRGICDIPQIYLRKFRSYRSMSSIDTLRQVAKECQLGFATNANSTNDIQTWINPGFRRLDFIEDVSKKSYISDTAFTMCFVDFYYNLCFVDLEKEIERDIENDKMILSSGFSKIQQQQELDEKVTTMVLTTEEFAKDSNAYVRNVEILNRSTKVSLNASYLTKTKYYDDVNKEMLIFNIDTLTTNKDKLILKGKTKDNSFYDENTISKWKGKMDRWDNGLGNSHDNMNFAEVHNMVNASELNKIDIDITLPNANYNLQLYQKVNFLLTYMKPGFQESIKHLRVAGEAIINSIEFVFDGNQFYQKVGLLRRDLEKTFEELETTNTTSENIEENFQDNDNPLGPTDQPLSDPTESTQTTNNVNNNNTNNTTNNTDTTTLSEKERIVKAMDILMNTHGASQYGAAAIVGNMIAESGLIVDRLETSLLNKKQSWKGGVSLVQWTGSRRLEFEQFFGIANSVDERKRLIGPNNENVEKYQEIVRQKVSFEAAIKYYWDELDRSLQVALKKSKSAEEAADAILADLRPGAYLCWRDWKKNRTYCTKGQITFDDALREKNKTRDKRVNRSLIAFNSYDEFKNNDLA